MVQDLQCKIKRMHILTKIHFKAVCKLLKCILVNMLMS